MATNIPKPSVFFGGGSTATSAATTHLLFGLFTGFSTLNNNETVLVYLQASGGDFRIGNAAVTNNTGHRFVSASASDFTFPIMRAGDASLLHIMREGANNPICHFAVYRPLD